MNEAKEKNGGPETKPTNKKKKQGAQVKIYKGKKKSIKKNSDATPAIQATYQRIETALVCY